MAVVPAAALTNWLPGAGTGIVNITAAGTYYNIPKAAVMTFTGGTADITDDIRDFLFSVLSRCAESYLATPGTNNSRVTNVIVSRSLSGGLEAGKGVATFSVTLKELTLAAPVATLPGTYL